MIIYQASENLGSTCLFENEISYSACVYVPSEPDLAMMDYFLAKPCLIHCADNNNSFLSTHLLHFFRKPDCFD